MVYLPLEIRYKIIDLSYKLMYNDVLKELECYFPEEPFLSFYYPFKRYILNFNNVIVFDDDNEFLSEVVFYSIPEIYFIY
tara:strand:+ start:2030 stop:2269 length:240 start_codon:yes stop_codon:yes gene_type:complete